MLDTAITLSMWFGLTMGLFVGVNLIADKVKEKFKKPLRGATKLV